MFDTAENLMFRPRIGCCCQWAYNYFTCWACSRFGQVIQNFSFDSIQKRFKKNSCVQESNTLNNVNESHNNITLVYSYILQ